MKTYQYPQSLTGGYGQLFEPHLPSRIGEPLMGFIMRGCKTQDVGAIEAAIDILSKQHQKRVHQPYVSYKEGECDHHTWCKPTQKAEILIEELKVIKSTFGNPLGLDLG